MTFVEAAVLLLRETGTQLSVEELAERAVARELLSKPGKAPLKSMKARLVAELRKGDASRVARVAQNTWALAAAVPKVIAESAAPAVVEPDPGPAPEPSPEPTAQLSNEERELSALYKDDLVPSKVGAAHAEYRDALSADEDRPMRPEILARDRRPRGPRRDRDRGRGRGRDRDKDRDRGRERDRNKAPAAQAASGPGVDYVSGALQVLAARDGRQPITTRQLSEAMKGRGLLRGAPPKPARAVKAALLHDTAVRRARGLRPQIEYLGADRFALATQGLGKDVTLAEEGLEAALRRLEAATRAALAERLSRLSLSELERAVGAYLQHVGWRDVEWLKRVGKSSYAVATAMATGDQWMLGLRIGPKSIDRRGLGELRAGVAAKKLAAGLLLSPAELSDEAAAELAKGGAHVSVLCGAAFATALAAAGVGVRAAAAPVLYLEPRFFAETTDE